MSATTGENRKEPKVDDLVQVMVPRRFLVDVYALIARLDAEEGLGDEGEEATETKMWTPELLRKFYEDSAPNMKRALNYLADNPDRWVPGPELGDAIKPGTGSRTLAGTFSGASRHAENYYGLDLLASFPDKKNPFLLDKEWGHVEHRRHTAAYRLDSVRAEQIRSYRREA